MEQVLENQSIGASPLDSDGGPVRVPRPARRWGTRVALPAAILTTAAGVLAYGARDALVPARLVEVAPVIVKTAASPGPGEPARDDGVEASNHGANTQADNVERAAPMMGAMMVQAPGWVEAAPYAVAASALTDGVIADVLALEGDAVEAGQIVARLVAEDAELEVRDAEAALAQREAELVAARAELDAARRTWDHPVERVRAVAAAEGRLAEARAELERLPAIIERETAALARLEDQWRRVENALADEATSEFEATRLRLEVQSQRAEVEATKREQALIEARVAQEEAELAAARENLELRIEERRALDLAEAAVAGTEAMVLEARAALDAARLRLERTEIRAPIAGRVMARLKEPGDKVMLGGDERQSAQILRLYREGQLQVRVDVPLADAAGVSVGQTAEIGVEILPDRVFRGEVTRVTHEADIQKNTLQVKVKVLDPSPLLKPEMLARVKFLPFTASGDDGADAGHPDRAMGGGGTAAAASPYRLFAPAAALHASEANAGAGNSAGAWIVVDRRRGKGVAEFRTLRLGAARGGEWREVIEGLQPGDLLIVSDAAGLDPGERVRFEESGASLSDATSGHDRHGRAGTPVFIETTATKG